MQNHPENVLEKICAECKRRVVECDKRIHYYAELNALRETGIDLSDKVAYEDLLSLANYIRAVNRIIDIKTKEKMNG